MFKKVVAWHRITGDLRAARMTGRAGAEMFFAGKFAQRGIFAVGVFVGVLLVVVRFQRAMAGFATNGALRHRGVIGVRGGVIIF